MAETPIYNNKCYLGMINILHGLGLRLLALGHHTPFMVQYDNSILLSF